MGWPGPRGNVIQEEPIPDTYPPTDVWGALYDVPPFGRWCEVVLGPNDDEVVRVQTRGRARRYHWWDKEAGLVNQCLVKVYHPGVGERDIAVERFKAWGEKC